VTNLRSQGARHLEPERKLKRLKRRFRGVSRRSGLDQRHRRSWSRSELQPIVLAAIVTAAFIVAGYVLFASQLPNSPSTSELDGRASVIDGDTIEIHGMRIRLHGIDAPESGQFCTRAGSRYRCGQAAALALADFIGQQTVNCMQSGTDRYERAIATCTVSGQDVGAWLVRNGHALAYRRFSNAYTDEEAAAKAARVGVWAGDFEPPWEWRREQQAE
jgi:endonuclease YncB( thermonuclease family)